jgi:transposase InsO family protein
VRRDFTPTHPDQLWVGDITYLRTREVRPTVRLGNPRFSLRLLLLTRHWATPP